MPTPRPIIGTRISVTVLKWVNRAARNRSMNAPATAVIAKSSGITVGTSARNRIIRMMNAATRPMMSLRPCVGGAFSASPVNCASMPAVLGDGAGSCSRRRRCPSAAAGTRSCRTGRRRTRSGRPSRADARSSPAGWCSSTRPWRGSRASAARRCPQRSSAGSRPCRCGVSSRWPGGAATTTRSAAPFWPRNLALIRSVAFWTSVPGMLKSLISVPWNAAFSPISTTKMPSQREDHPPRVAGEVPAHPGLQARVCDPAFVLQLGVLRDQS